jgi:hypothetical protein
MVASDFLFGEARKGEDVIIECHLPAGRFQPHRDCGRGTTGGEQVRAGRMFGTVCDVNPTVVSHFTSGNDGK